MAVKYHRVYVTERRMGGYIKHYTLDFMTMESAVKFRDETNAQKGRLFVEHHIDVIE